MCGFLLLFLPCLLVSFFLSFITILQLSDDHSLEQSTGLIEVKLLDYFGLLTTEEIQGLQNGNPASAA